MLLKSSLYFGRFRQVGLVTLMTGLSIFGGSGIASAHQLGTSNGISIIMHVEPDDLPIAGPATNIHLYYGTSLPGISFNLTRCDCTVVLKDSTGVVVSSSKVTPDFGSGTEADVSLKFPKIGVYQMVAAGTAQAGAFPSFSVPFTIRVERASAVSARTVTNGLRFGILGSGIAVVVGLLVIPAYRDRTPKRTLTKKAIK